VQPFREYNSPPFNVVVLHGGPGAPGEMAPVAKDLSQYYSVLEPFQTADSLEGQVEELKGIIEQKCVTPVTLVGWSWGAWLGFITSALYPALVKKLILISSGAYEDRYAQNIVQTRLDRLECDELAEAYSLMGAMNDPEIDDKDTGFARLGELISKADAYDPLLHENEILEYNHDIYKKVWEDAAKLRTSGDLLKLATLIQCPVTAIHGDHDPHLAEGVKEPLSNVLKDFEFILLEKCGHHPWYEKNAREMFFILLKDEI